jgi:hypothetical protein
MAIALSCPSCVQALKVKDELAGRKIKCPKCGGVIPVPGKKDGSETRITAKKPRNPPVEEDEEPEEGERPKKKKKKKAKSNRGLVIGSAIGGVVLILVVVLFLFLPRGEEKKVAQVNRAPAKPAVQKEDPKPDPEPTPKAPASTGVGRVRDRVEISNILKNLGIAYEQFEVEQNRGPKNPSELLTWLKANTGPMNDYLANKWITVIWSVKPSSGFPNGSSNTILAYETDADRQGLRLVLRGDKSVDLMDEVTFQKTPKAIGK